MNLDITKYPNLLDKIDLSSSDITNQILNYKLEFYNYRDSKVEWQMNLPMFLDTFYDLIIKNNIIPTQSELWHAYEKVLPTDINDSLKGIKARLYRAYPSLVRDIHFSKYLEEHVINGAKIIYNKVLDVEHGIDIIIDFKNQLYALNLFTKTKRAFLGREKKSHRHIHIDNIVPIDLPLKLQEENKVGDFYLFKEKQLHELKSILKKIIRKS
ncbi:TaqI family restriction endonuclease [Flavivirga algicola]|uniref:TaqI family restriction endonuclease n=1 Tax=Flavivirga algicola TaxID=2729136 RepID=A0ABX1RYI2_9FLAO|nr:TaqI family restriction endonuclease [Flavivirga algicola]NMH87400.1 TaqI family restriction endonuclease [Flavivirga algicola]